MEPLYQSLFSPARRLLELQGEGPVAELAVEACLGREALSELSEWRIVAVCANARLALKRLLGKVVTLFTTLADGGRMRRSGLVRKAEKLGADGGLARYRLTVVPWLWLATQQRHSQIFQNRTVADITEQILRGYAMHAVWRYTADAQQRIDAIGPREQVGQYRETDYAFLSRLFAEAGLGFTFVDDADAPSGHVMTIFADSAQLPQGQQATVRYHRADSQQQTDAVQQLACHRRVTVPGVAVVAWDGNAKRTLRGHAAARAGGGALCPEPYLSVSHSMVGDAAGAQRLAEQLMESIEARARLFAGQGTVRSFASGTRIAVQDCPHLPRREQDGDANHALLLDIVEHCSINNLATETRTALGQRLGPLDAALCFDTPPTAPENGPMTMGFLVPGELVERLAPAESLRRAAERHGYANQFRACDARLPWRPRVADVRGSRLFAAPTAAGVHTATVVGPNGEATPQGDAEHHVSPRGEIRVRFPWQRGQRADDRCTRWVGVAQRHASAGMGWQWLPRIGQEVLIKFTDDDIDQPIVIGALYNGQGEGGTAPTPGGKPTVARYHGVLRRGSDTVAIGQANVAGGHAPAWHGISAAPDGHRNAAALTGFKSREHGGEGANQLVFDDSDGQLRTQLATTKECSQLNLGHLIHQQDNYRGSFRGEGFELRTDCHVALRGKAGVLLTTYRDAHTSRPILTGDNAAGIALIRQAKALTGALGEGAAWLQVPAPLTGKGDEAPMVKLETAVSGMVDGEDHRTATEDATSGNVQTEGKVPYASEAIVQMTGRAGLVMVCGRELQWINGKALAVASGADTNVAIGKQARLHGGQAVGIAAALEKAGAGDTGLKLIAGQQDIDVQAQHDGIRLQARDALTVVSANMQVDFAASKRVRVATAGGASITIEGGSITVQCPGAITYKSAQRTFAAPAGHCCPLPNIPTTLWHPSGAFPYS